MNCIYTVNVNDFVTTLARKRFRSAARRWGCDYAELLHDILPGYSSCTKLAGAERLAGYEKLAFFDGDALISEHAPNPFDLCVAEDTLYAVSDCQGPNPCDAWREVVYHLGINAGLEKKPDFKTPDELRFFNSGFWMYRKSAKIREMFAVAIESLPKSPRPYAEQGTLNLIAHNLVQVELLPETWNHLIPHNQKLIPDYYVNHFGGWAQPGLRALSELVENEGELDVLARHHGTDKSSLTKAHHGYTRHYDKFLSKWRQQPIKMLEIGVYRGNSIKMWLDYFYQANVHGVDLTNEFSVPKEMPVVDPGFAGRDHSPQPSLASSRYTFTQGNQSDSAFWKSFISQHGGSWDLIVDDGGHTNKGIITSFECLWPNISPGGYYVIEDLYCAYRPPYILNGFANHIDFIKTFLDAINKSERDMDTLYFSTELAILRKRGCNPHD